MELASTELKGFQYENQLIWITQAHFFLFKCQEILTFLLLTLFHIFFPTKSWIPNEMQIFWVKVFKSLSFLHNLKKCIIKHIRRFYQTTLAQYLISRKKKSAKISFRVLRNSQHCTTYSSSDLFGVCPTSDSLSLSFVSSRVLL